MMRTRMEESRKLLKIRTDSGADGLTSLMECPLVTPCCTEVPYVADIRQYFADLACRTIS